MANCYAYGKGVKQNIQKAVKYYQQSAKKDNPDALLILGKLYEKGQWINKDLI